MRRIRYCPTAVGGTLLLACFLSGCGGGGSVELGQVTGTVLLDGQPLPQATIVFEPEEGSISMGRTDDSGQYQLKFTLDKAGAMPGRHTVRINTGDEVVPEVVPVRYWHKSELTREVTPGKNVIDFDLESDGLVLQPHEQERLERLE